MCSYSILWDGGGFPWVLVKSRFFHDEERSLGFGVLRIGGYIVMVHAFIGGFRVSPDAAWIEMKSLLYRACDFSFGQWT